MVGGRQVLLSLAVLYGAGPDSALGGLLRPQDGYQSIGGANFANTTRQTSSSLPSPETSTISTISTITSATLVASSIPEPGTTMTTSSIRRPPVLPPVVVIQSVVSSVVESSSVVLGLGVIQATVATNSASPTSKGEEYVYPAVGGADGALTTESEAFTRSVVATRDSVVPNPGTGRAPPPVDVPVTSSSSAVRGIPTRPPIRPEPAVPDGAEEPEDTPVEETSVVATPVRTRAPGVIPTPPRGGNGIPTKTLASTSEGITLTFGLGYGDETTTRPTNTWGGFSNSSGFYPNQTITSAPRASSSLSLCQASDYTKPSTIWSIIHTETITWYGNPEDYTPSYPPIVTPTLGSTCVEPMSPPRFTISVCTSTGSGSQYVTCHFSTSTDWNYGPGINSRPTVNPITFTTTDKNPAVVFSTRDLPDYGVSQEASTRHNHVSPTDHPAPSSPPQYQSQGPDRNTEGGNGSPQYMSSEPARQPPTTPAPEPITVIVQPTQVIIGSSTITDKPSDPTQVVVVSDETFTIDPTRVVGGGATIDRPSITGGGVIYPPTPMTTTLANVPVVITSSIAIIGGSTFTLGPTSTTAVIAGKTFTINPSGVTVETQTFTLPSRPVPTEVVVAGGELITAIGPSVLVIKSTTITYGPSSMITTQIGDEKLTLGPGGVTLGSGEVITAKPGETQFAVAGGVTITKIGASVVVVASSTYTIGPQMGTTSTVVEVGGEKVTIGNEGVKVGTVLSIAVPFGPVTVITPGATRALGAGGARETGVSGTGRGGNGGEGGVGGGEEDGEEDAGVMVRPGLGILGTLFAAVLVWIL
ncbi:hypothetical protein QBC43DRAFT_35711 [Cladorrhinum sp. PSN259]|nr:hypothetical protein QBC43DRAFT_35711 [Cladorrhinum sp. PSN259]